MDANGIGLPERAKPESVGYNCPLHLQPKDSPAVETRDIRSRWLPWAICGWHCQHPPLTHPFCPSMTEEPFSPTHSFCFVCAAPLSGGLWSFAGHPVSSRGLHSCHLTYQVVTFIPLVSFCSINGPSTAVITTGELRAQQTELCPRVA